MAQEETKTAEAPAAPAAAPAKAPSAWPPLIAVIVLMPLVSFATTKFLILPKIRGASTEEAAKEEHGAKDAHGSKDAHGKPAAAHGAKDAKGGHEATGKFTYDFENVVVNLSGSLGTKYLKTSFTLFSSNQNLKKLVEENKKQLLDVTINVLSSRTMADLEAAGAKNVVRNELMASLNQALHSDLIEQLYYSEFVVQ
ncbi:MAG: flagellar basal body-associated FliL family protein [Chthoniobacteraceae bacterium]